MNVHPDLADKTPGELDAMLREMAGDAPPPVPAPAPVEQAAPEAPPAAELAPEPAPTSEPALTEEIDWRARAEKAEQHSARLAGKVGFLEGRVKALAGGSPQADGADDAPAPVYEDTTDVQLLHEQQAALADQVQDLAAREYQREQAAISEKKAAIEEEIVNAGARDLSLAKVDPDIWAGVQAELADRGEQIDTIEDPDRYRVELINFASTALAVATSRQAERNTATLTARSAESSANIRKAKIAATISASGSTPSPRPQPRSHADMSIKELDAWLRENVT